MSTRRTDALSRSIAADMAARSSVGSVLARTDGDPERVRNEVNVPDQAPGRERRQQQSQIAKNVAVSHGAFVTAPGVPVNYAIFPSPRSRASLIDDEVDRVFGAAFERCDNLRSAGFIPGLRADADDSETGIAGAKGFRGERHRDALRAD